MRLLIEVPEALFAIGARFLEKQPFGKIVVEWQRQLLAVVRLRIGHASIERRGRFVGEGWRRVEPGEQPGVEVAAVQPSRVDPAGLQRGD
ncbi:hypothetical protein D3C79_1021200 [compost metagenome]